MLAGLGRARGGVLLGLAVAVVALVGWLSVRNPSASASGAAPARSVPATESAPDWSAVLGELDAKRVAYYGGTGAVDAVDVPGSQVARDDEGRRHALQDKQVRPDGLHPTIADVQVVRAEPDVVELLVTDTLPSYRLVRAGRIGRRGRAGPRDEGLARDAAASRPHVRLALRRGHCRVSRLAASLGAKRRGEAGGDVRIGEGEPGLLQHTGEDALPGEDALVGERTEREPDREPRGRERPPGGAAPCPARGQSPSVAAGSGR